MFLLIYCLYKKKNNQMCFTSHKVFNDEAIKNDPELDHKFSGVLCTHYGELN